MNVRADRTRTRSFTKVRNTPTKESSRTYKSSFPCWKRLASWSKSTTKKLPRTWTWHRVE